MRRLTFLIAVVFAFASASASPDPGQQPKKPKPEWLKHTFVGLDTAWNGKTGGALVGAYQFKGTGVLLEAALGYEYGPDVSGTVSHVVGCNQYVLPWEQTGGGGKVYRLGFRIPLAKP